MSIDCGAPQISVLGLLAFLIYINDFSKAIQYCNVYLFSVDTNLLHTSKSIKKLDKLVKRDIKHFNNYLSANKISLNIKETELVIFKTPRKVLSDQVRIKLMEKGYIYQAR